MSVQTQTVKLQMSVELAGQMFWTLLASVVTIIVSALFWKFGADFTIIALKWFSRAFGEPTDNAWWLAVPVLFSAIELSAWKLGDRLTPRVRKLALGMTALDMGSTAFGVLIAIITRYVPMLGITAPSHWVYAISFVVASLVGCLVTLYPERNALDGFIQIFQVGKAFVTIMRGTK